jgi:hypothetical protein
MTAAACLLHCASLQYTLTCARDTLGTSTNSSDSSVLLLRILNVTILIVVVCVTLSLLVASEVVLLEFSTQYSRCRRARSPNYPVTFYYAGYQFQPCISQSIVTA